jgi:hypothetical protein
MLKSFLLTLAGGRKFAAGGMGADAVLPDDVGVVVVGGSAIVTFSYKE